jgi:Flp pilus assembly protein TadG
MPRPFKPFLESADGAVAIIFALATVPLLAAVGVAVD